MQIAYAEKPLISIPAQVYMPGFVMKMILSFQPINQSIEYTIILLTHTKIN